VAGVSETESRGTFDSAETPGWTSILHPEPRFDLTAREHPKVNNIFDHLNKLDSIDLTNSTYSKIRVDNSSNQNMLNSKMQRSTIVDRSNKENEPTQPRHSVNKEDCQRLASTRNRTDSRLLSNSLISSDISSRHNRSSGINLKLRTATEQSSVHQKPKEKRFNQITVHDHLYVDSKRH
jgi:hypothetical protein